jgi:hypothetical protein
MTALVRRFIGANEFTLGLSMSHSAQLMLPARALQSLASCKHLLHQTGAPVRATPKPGVVLGRQRPLLKP